MSFYSDASLVMIPSGYKNGKVYSAVPTDGTGDMSFTRASNATRVASNGLIEKVRTNLFAYSEELDNGYWAKVAAGSAAAPVVTANAAVAPNGTTTADRVYFDAVGTTSSDRSGLVRDFAFTIGQTYTISAYAKSATGSNQILQFRIAGTQTTPELTATGDWQRFTATFTATTSITDNFGIQLRGNNTTNEADLYLWGMQLELSDVMTDYIATTTTAVSVGPVSGLPRLDYLNSSCPRLLLEPQRTNLFKYSEQFNNAFWTKSGTTLTPNTTISPDGYQNADTMTTNASTSRIIDTTIYGAGTYTGSLYVKRLTGNDDFQFRFVVDGSNQIQNFDVTSEWQRFTFTVTAASTLDNLQFRSAGVGTGTFAVWGAQLEAGSYATSYIPTLSTSVTRVADNAYKTGISSLIGQTEGTLFAEFSGIEQEADFPNLTPTISDGTNNNRIMVYHDPGGVNAIFVRVVVGGSSTINTSALSAPVYLSNNKIAIAYKNNDYVVYFNGTQIYTNTSAGAPPACSKVDIFNNALSNNYSKVEGKTNLIFKTRLSNSDLASLTTL